ncbi:MAG: cytochrome c oxidase subunit II [Alphaproteobacteria bacterium]
MICVANISGVIKAVLLRLNILKTSAVTGGVLGVAAVSNLALAAKPEAWKMGLPEPVTPLARMMKEFHDLWLLPVVFGVSIFVMILIAYTCWRFSEKRNPIPSKTTHNASLEVLWTGIPVIILLVLAFPSLRLLYATDNVADSDMTLKITGYQWYWNYEYPDHGGFNIDAYLAARTQEEAIEYNAERLLDTDNRIVIPTDTKIRLQFTSGDVLHNWSLSDFGVRVDTVPGRLSEAWVLVEKPGRYYGFCSELCGVDHAYMPIMIDAVSPAEFDEWVLEAQDEFAATIPQNQIKSQLASAE